MSLPSYESLGGDATGVRVMDLLFQDYAEAGQAPNSGMGAWEGRTYYDIMAGMSIDASINKHRREWRAELGLPPIPVPEAPIAPRTFTGNFCGVRVPGLPAVPGSSTAVPDLVLSWFYNRYDADWRAKMRETWRSKGYLDVVLSWPDSRATGTSPEQFVDLCRELVNDGFLPTVFLLSKEFDPHQDVPGCLANINQVLDLLLSPRACSRICVGWELGIDSWLLPPQVQEIVDYVAPKCVAAQVKCYVHFQQGYAHLDWGPNVTFAGYWNREIGKLTGLLHQRDLSWSAEEYQSRMNDILLRFAGGFNCSPDSGFGHPFDLIAFEITAQPQFNGQTSEAQGDALGRVALGSPTAQGPFGAVSVMGSGNGQ